MSLLARYPEPLALHLHGSALVMELGPVRRRLATWASGHGLPADTVEDLVLAAYEALANVVDHAYPEGGGQAWINGDCVAGTLVVVIRDRGRWRPPPQDPGRRGHGMTIINGLAEQVDIRRTRDGTSVEMRWALPG